MSAPLSGRSQKVCTGLPVEILSRVGRYQRRSQKFFADLSSVRAGAFTVIISCPHLLALFLIELHLLWCVSQDSMDRAGDGIVFHILTFFSSVPRVDPWTKDTQVRDTGSFPRFFASFF